MTTKIKAPYTSGQTLTATVTEQDDSNPVSATSVTGVDSVYTAVFPTIPDGVYVVRFFSGATAVRADLVRVSADREFNWVASEDLAESSGSIDLKKLLESDQRIANEGGKLVLKTFERGTSTELIPAKNALGVDGQQLTDTDSPLGGFAEA